MFPTMRSTFRTFTETCIASQHPKRSVAAADGATLDQAKKRVSDYLIAKYAAKFDPRFPQSVGSNVITAYQVIAFAP